MSCTGAVGGQGANCVHLGMHVCNLPTWVHCPDAERVEWLNKVVKPFFVSSYREVLSRNHRTSCVGSKCSTSAPSVSQKLMWVSSPLESVVLRFIQNCKQKTNYSEPSD